MATVDISDSDFDQKVLQSKTPVLVDLWASWCAPCKMAEPVLEQLSDEYAGKLTIVKMDVDKNSATPAKYSVFSIPTTILFKGAVEVGRQVGFSGKEAYEELIKKVVI